VQKSFVVKATLCIEDCQFYLRAGDVLMFESTARRLTVYRANEIIKTLTQTPLGIAAMLKTGILQEVTPQVSAPVAVAAPQKPAPAVSKPAPVKPAEKEIAQKRAKAVPREVRIEDAPRLQEALAQKTPEPIA
jgi:hypothetical protein